MYKKAEEQGKYSQAYDYARDGGSYDDGYSQRMYPMYFDGNSMDYSQARRGRDGDGDGRYSEDNSYRRGRYSRGSYEYSRHGEKDKMIDELNNLMMNAKLSDREKEAVKKCIAEIDN